MSSGDSFIFQTGILPQYPVSTTFDIQEVLPEPGNFTETNAVIEAVDLERKALLGDFPYAPAEGS